MRFELRGAGKHVPMRTCVGCSQERSKRALLRIARRAGGGVSLDATGSAEGRGAYLCPDMNCVSLARKRNGLSRSLKITVSSDDWNEIEQATRSMVESTVRNPQSK